MYLYSDCFSLLFAFLTRNTWQAAKQEKDNKNEQEVNKSQHTCKKHHTDPEPLAHVVAVPSGEGVGVQDQIEAKLGSLELKILIVKL